MIGTHKLWMAISHAFASWQAVRYTYKQVLNVWECWSVCVSLCFPSQHIGLLSASLGSTGKWLVGVAGMTGITLKPNQSDAPRRHIQIDIINFIRIRRYLLVSRLFYLVFWSIGISLALARSDAMLSLPPNTHNQCNEWLCVGEQPGGGKNKTISHCAVEQQTCEHRTKNKKTTRMNVYCIH